MSKVPFHCIVCCSNIHIFEAGMRERWERLPCNPDSAAHLGGTRPKTKRTQIEMRFFI
jgi:hypothetical protein